MKFTKLALAAAIVAGSSSSVVAQQTGNTASVDTDVLVYVAAGLTVEVTQQLIFSDIVIPAEGSGILSGMSMDCETGDVSYRNAGSNPNGPAGDAITGTGGANANGNKQNANVGQILVEGEPDYAISVSASVGNLPQGVTFTPWLGWNNSINPISRSLNGMGKKRVAFCGEMTADDTVETTETLEVPLVINISYR